MKQHTDGEDNKQITDLISKLLSIIEKIDDGKDILPEAPIDYIAAIGTLRKDFLLAKDVLAIMESGSGLGAEALGRIIVEDMIFLRYLKSQSDQQVKDRFMFHPSVQHYQMFQEAKQHGIDLGDISDYKNKFDAHEGMFRRVDGTYWNNWACKKMADIFDAVIDADLSGGAAEMMPFVISAYDKGSEIIHHNATVIMMLNISEGFREIGKIRAFNGLSDTFLALADVTEIAINEKRQRQDDGSAFLEEQIELISVVEDYNDAQLAMNKSLGY